jgi:hypothetical protein
LYERQYNQQNVEPGKPEGVSEKQDTQAFTEIHALPVLVEQLNYRSEVERVDTQIFKNKITCECGNHRWVKNSDMFQTKCCKPCAQRKRRDRRKVKKVAATTRCL